MSHEQRRRRLATAVRLALEERHATGGTATQDQVREWTRQYAASSGYRDIMDAEIDEICRTPLAELFR